MQLFVRTLTGRTVVVEAADVAGVKAAVEAATLVPAAAQRLVFGGASLEGGALADLLPADATVEMVVDAEGGKKKKKKKKVFKGPKKNAHRHKNVPMRVLKFYDVTGDGDAEEYKVTRKRMECPHPDCGAGVFMAQHKDRQTCGKCSLTYVKK